MKKTNGSLRKILLWIIAAAVALLAGCGNAGTGFQGKTPFGHTYRVEEVLESGDSAPEQLPLVRLDYRMEDILEWMEVPGSDQWTTIGTMEFQEEQTDPGQKGLWLLTTENGSQYRLTVEEDDSVILTLEQDGQTQWKYRLSRVDTLVCTVKSSYATESPVLDWFPQGAFDGELSSVNGADVPGDGTVTFHWLVGETDTLTVIETYCADGQVETTEHLLNADNKGQFALPVQTHGEGENQYAFYRVPFDTGEYIFAIRFS